MLPGPDKPAGEKEDGIEVDHACCRETRDGSELEEDYRHHDGHEELKKPFDPEVDDPESPGVNYRKMGRAIEEHRRQIKDRDRDCSAQKQYGDLAALGITQCRDSSANQQTKPAQQCDSKQHLPGAAELEVFPPLV